MYCPDLTTVDLRSRPRAAAFQEYILRRILTLVAVSFALNAVALVAQAPTPAGAPVLRPGDAVRITVWRKPELTGEFPIVQDGTIAHPLYRGVSVAGLRFAEAEARVAELLRRYEANPQFVMQPLLRVSVAGEVRQPSLYTLPPETSIAQAVALAGGATERGRMEEVRLLREGREYVLDLTQPTAGMAQEPIRSGDQIFVKRSRNIFRDYIAPAGSVTAALAAIINIILR